VETVRRVVGSKQYREIAVLAPLKVLNAARALT